PVFAVAGHADDVVAELAGVGPGHKDILPGCPCWASQLRCHLFVQQTRGDLDQAREWVTDVLGKLASPTDNDALLRDTLRVFLNCGASYKLAAEELVLHFNTVKYRVGRALTRRGRGIANDRLDVELALLLCHWFGNAVLLRAKT
ncbi:MAG: helix-turn-helix domain-containing protein, partial [Mycobacterium sp.]|nr:helix-turn-helix domain-containing protein [Mycobacterium sp.]